MQVINGADAGINVTHNVA